MIRKAAMLAGLLAMTVSPLLADFSYQEKSTVTGGALMSLLKIAGVFSKQAREPLQTTISVKGDRMVSRGANHMSIIDLNAQTITTVDMQKKTWYVMTFDQMKQMLDQMQQNMKNAKNKNGEDVKMDFKVSAKSTGNSKQVNGYDAKEMVIRMEMQGTDPDSGQQGSMVITSDMWVAPTVTGYNEVRSFQKRMAEKLSWSPTGNMFASRPDVSEGMAQVYKEASKLEGIPVQQNVVMSMEGQPGQQGQQSQTQSQPQQQQQQSVERPSLSGALGGIMGVRRNKKSSNDPPPDANKNGSSQPGSLLEMTTEMSSFSSAPVDDSQFTVPANFKKIDPPAMRGAK